MPLTLEGKSVFGDMGAMLIDSLDTLWMMGLKPEFDRYETVFYTALHCTAVEASAGDDTF